MPAAWTGALYAKWLERYLRFQSANLSWPILTIVGDRKVTVWFWFCFCGKANKKRADNNNKKAKAVVHYWDAQQLS
eukprot:SAG31_NODE_333_length_17527_cov_6.972056_17_plen_76_part_00